MKFATRAVIGTIWILTLAMIVVVWLAGRSLRRDLEHQTNAELLRHARIVREAIGTDTTRWQQRVRTIGQANQLRITLIDRDGTVVADSDIPNPGRTVIENHSDRPEVLAALRGEAGSARRHSETVGAEMYYVAIRGGPGVVRVATSLRQMNQTLRGSLRSVAWAALLALVVGSIIALLAVRSITNPLRGLASAARAIAAGNLPRFPRSGVREIDGLVVSLREMHSQLTDRFGDLRREQSETAALVGAMVEGVLATDATGAIVTANPAARDLLGYPDGQILPDLPTIFKSRDAQAVVHGVLAGESLSGEIALGDRMLLVHARPLTTGGAVLILYDLTEVRRLEAARRDFVANVSHELKTPLTSITGYSETLLGERPDEATTTRFLETIHANAQRMQHLVDDLLDLSRIESGGWEPHQETVAVASLAAEEWAVARDARGQDRMFEIDCPADLTGYADPEALRHVLGNLFDNAIRHTEPGGRIRFRAHPETDGLVIEISDDGTGILTEHLPRIFERFYRVDASRSRAEGGTGLGLAIVKHMVEAHGGSVEAQSELGVGTTIRCRFPDPPTGL